MPTREKPSAVTKERLSQLMQQEVLDCGKVARQICQQSGSREVTVVVVCVGLSYHKPIRLW